MTLDQYLKQNRIQGRRFAAHLGIHPSKVTRLRKGQRQPSVDLAAKIEAATGGAVRISDFLMLDPTKIALPAIIGAEEVTA